MAIVEREVSEKINLLFYFKNKKNVSLLFKDKFNCI